jgi:hypothetical protein
MIALSEKEPQRRVFDAVRTTVQEIHPETVFENDACGSPFLLKSSNDKVWVRVFYQPMGDSNSDELASELKKLKVVMPKDARMYLFYPRLDREQMIKFRTVGDRLAFFEYGGLSAEPTEAREVRVRRWVPASEVTHTVDRKVMAVSGRTPGQFLGHTRLSSTEIAGLAELGLGLKTA